MATGGTMEQTYIPKLPNLHVIHTSEKHNPPTEQSKKDKKNHHQKSTE